MSEAQAKAALGNWERGLFRPEPSTADVQNIARALGVGVNDLMVWNACHRFCSDGAA